jgi:hypothetical protein
MLLRKMIVKVIKNKKHHLEIFVNLLEQEVLRKYNYNITEIIIPSLRKI